MTSLNVSSASFDDRPSLSSGSFVAHEDESLGSSQQDKYRDNHHDAVADACSSPEHKSNDDDESDNSIGAMVWQLVLWYMFLEPEDSFLVRLRKVSVSMLLPCTAAPLGYLTFFTYLIVTGAQEETTGLYVTMVCNIFLILTLSLPYVLARRAGDVSQLVLDVVIAGITTCFVGIVFSNPPFGNRTTTVSIALLAICAQTRLIGIVMAILVLLFVIDSVNNAYLLRDNQTLLLIPGFRQGTALEEVIGELCAVSIVGLMTLAVYLQSLDQQRQVKEARAAVVLSHEVVELLRRYNTAGVSEALAKAKGEVDAEILDSLGAMNANLQTYKPYLPNFLFIPSDDSDSNADDDDDCDAKRLDSDDEGSMELDKVSSRSILSNGSSASSRTSTSQLSNSQRVLRQAAKALMSPLGRSHPSSKNLLRKSSSGAQNNNGVFRGSVTLAFLEFPQQVARLQAFVEAVHLAAKATRGSLHTMVGDAVIVSWNATTRVAQPEMKAVKFVTKVSRECGVPHTEGIAAEAIAPATAIFTGHAQVLSTTSSIHQHAHIIVADWMAAAQCAFRLARQERCQLMCERTRDVAQNFVECLPVDSLRYSSECQGRAASLCELLLSKGPEGVESSNEFDRDRTLYEIGAEKSQQADDEWMYQLQQQRKSVSAAADPIIAAHAALSNARYGDAVGQFEALPSFEGISVGSAMVRRMHRAAESAFHQNSMKQ